jgi:hypothetical protein
MHTKNIVLPILILVAFGLAVMLFLRSRPFIALEQDPDGRVLMDSVKLKANTLYWFKVQKALSSSPVSYMSTADSPCDLADSTAILKGLGIYSIAAVREDTVYIHSQHGFDINDHFNSGKLIFVDLGSDSGVLNNRQTMKEDVLIKVLCEKVNRKRR